MNGTDRTGLIAAVLFVVAIFAMSRGEEAEDRLDVALVGDSFLEQSSDQFRALADEEGLTVDIWALGGTSLCGWDRYLADIAEGRPERLVLSFAGNDMQPCSNPQAVARDPAVVAETYRQDLDEVLERFRESGTDVYLVAPPPVADPAFDGYAQAMRDMYTAYGIEHPGVTVVESMERLGPDGAYHDALPCEEDEDDVCRPDGTVVLRQEDDMHLSPEGGDRYAEAIMDAIAADS